MVGKEMEARSRDDKETRRRSVRATARERNEYVRLCVEET